ncbi:unnamed protein product [Rotaria sp. Silwood2]|nr:unnamed protein product [Rotaria sp. Silwood2]
MDGIINNWFSSADIIDMSETVSVDLRQLDINILPVITFIQACQAFTKFMPINICKCRGLCNTKRCPRKRQSLLCCTKCHRVRPNFESGKLDRNLMARWRRTLRTPESINEHVIVFEQDLCQLVEKLKEFVYLDIYGNIDYDRS